ncbi:MAG: serine/threonine-protein kinase [Gemmatimonas sp.]
MQEPDHSAGDWWTRVSEAFETVAEAPDDMRAARLDALDPQLRDEVDSLLRAQESATDRFARPAAVIAVDDSSPLSEAGLEAGAALGPYRVVREVGRGGMGSVFEAYRVDDDFRKRVALKTISVGRALPGIVERFRRERRILARLEHRNIAALLDGGVTPEGAPYFAMEYVEGVPIDEYCRAHQLSLQQRLQLMRQTCGAVHFAHQSLVVHRDLKPGNIFVTADGTVKLLDFGIAKVLVADEDSDAHAHDLTGVDASPFTLAYASPEQLLGAPVTTASDVYALGVVLFAVVTDSHPFRRAGMTSAAMRQRILTDSPPSTGLGADLDAIVGRAMHKDYTRRYSSAEQLADDLRRLVDGQPVLAQPDSMGYRAMKFARRNRVGVVATALSVISLVAASAVSIWQARVASDERDRARTEAAKANRVTQFVQDMLRSADPRASGPNLTVADALAAAAQRADSSLSGEPEILASVQTTIGLSYLGLGQYPEAERLLQRALALRRARGAVAAKETAASLRHLATVYSERGELAPADSLFQESLTVYRALHEPDSSGMADVLIALADLTQYKGDLVKAEALNREALGIRTRLDGPSSESIAVILNNIAVIQGQRGRWVEAESLTRAALDIATTAHGAQHPDVAALLNSLAFAVQSQGRVPAAESLYRSALAIRVKTLGPNHPETARSYMNLGWLLHDSQRYALAANEAAHVLALRATLGDDHPAIGSTLILQGQSLLALGQLASGEAALRDALRIRERALPPEHWLIAASRSALGEALMLRNQFAESERLLLPAYDRLRSARGDSAELTVLARRRLAKLYVGWRKPAEAARYAPR